MKRILTLMISSFVIFISSCSTENNWTDEVKNMFLTSCKDEMRSQGKTQDQQDNICNCRMNKLMTEFPHYESMFTEENIERTQVIFNECQ